MNARTLLPVLAMLCALDYTAHAQEAPTAASIVVKVVDEEGAPAPGAEVTCVAAGSSDMGPARTEPLRPEEQMLTDAGGMCRFDGLPAEGHSLRAATGAFQALVGAQASTEPEPVVMALESAPPVRGRVSDLRGEPLEGVVLSLQTRLPVAVTDAAGNFEIGALPQRDRLLIAKPGFATLEYSFPRDDMVIGLEPGARATVNVVDEGGAPLAGPHVYVRAARRSDTEAVVDAMGEFRTEWFPIGLEVSLEGYAQNETTLWRGQTSYIVGSADQTVTLALEGQPIPEEGASREDRTTLSGKVVTAEGDKPVAASVQYGPNHPSINSLDEGGKTGEDGTFLLENLPKRKLYVMAVPKDRGLYPVEGVIQVDLTQGAVEGLVLTAAPGAVVRGRVENADGTAPPRNWVTLSGGGQRWDEMTALNGFFRFGNLPPLDKPATLTYNQRSIKLPTLPVGVTEDVVIQLPAESDKLTISGVVVDASGQPAPGVNVNLKKGELGEPNHEFAHAESDGLGRFKAEFKNMLPGPIAATLYHPQQFEYGEIDQRTGRECQIVEGGAIEVREGEPPAPMRIVVEVPPLEYLAGTVEDAEGNALDAVLTFLYGDYRDDRINDVYSGYFLSFRLPDEPFLLEVIAEDYKPVILRTGEDFERTDPALHVVLEPGPFAEDASVWTEVTGEPDTEEAIAAFIQGERIKRKEEEYRRVAQADDAAPTPSGPPEPTAPTELELLVTDPQGNPVTRLIAQPASVAGGQLVYNLSRPIAMAGPHAASQVMTNAEGRYTVPNGSLVEAAGTARYLVIVMPGEEYAPPIRLTLDPPATITVHTADHDGNPVEGVALGAADSMWQYLSWNYHGLPRTDAKGDVKLTDMPPSEYALAVVEVREPVGGVMPRSEPQPVFVHVDPGEDVRVNVTVGAPKPGSPEAIFEQWLQAVREQRDRAQTPSLSDKERNELERWLVGRLDETRRVGQLNQHEVDAMAVLASKLEMKKAVKPLKALAKRLEIDPQISSWYGGFPNSIITAIATLEGNDAVGFMASLAGDDTVDPTLRSYAVVALGTIGTDDAVTAFKRLRDAAYAKPGAPERKDKYTHAERMAEAVQMTLYAIPGIPPQREVSLESARIDEQYATGEITIGNAMSGATTLKMRRFGDEWLIVEIGSTVIA